jgi:hypothetical protein
MSGGAIHMFATASASSRISRMVCADISRPRVAAGPLQPTLAAL